LKVRNFFMLCMYIFLLWAVSLEVLDYFNTKIKLDRAGGYEIDRSLENTKRVVLSAAWLLYALIGLGAGILYRSSVARYLSVSLFIVTIVKIFIYDTANLSDVYRFVSFISLGVILLIAGYAYYRFKERILHFVKAEEETKSIS